MVTFVTALYVDAAFSSTPAEPAVQIEPYIIEGLDNIDCMFLY